MAEASISVGQDQFTCPICLHLMKDPVTILCGHSYCMACIKGCWDQDNHTGVYRCPQCRETFTPRPVLRRNTMLAEVVEKLKMTGLQAAPAQVRAQSDTARHLEMTQRKFQKRIQEREKKLQDLRQAVESLTRSAQAAVEDSERIFTELIHSIERRRSEVKELIRDQEKAAVSRAKRLLEQLQQEIAELRRRDAELERLSHTEDHIHFLQSCQSLCAPPRPADLPSITVSPHLSFEAVRKSISELKEQREDICKGEIDKISTTVKDVHILEPRTREDFLQYSSQLTLDPNTAHRNLRLSEGNRVVTWVGETQSYPDHPERFDIWPQLLCRESLSGRCYWEAEWSGLYGVSITVSYKEINRKGRNSDSSLGWNDKSWSLDCCPSTYSFWYNNKSIEIPAPPSSRIGVYLDHRAGTLSFYSVSDTMTLIHRVQTTFTQSLYPGFGCGYETSLKLCDLG